MDELIEAEGDVIEPTLRSGTSEKFFDDVLVIVKRTDGWERWLRGGAVSPAKRGEFECGAGDVEGNAPRVEFTREDAISRTDAVSGIRETGIELKEG